MSDTVSAAEARRLKILAKAGARLAKITGDAAPEVDASQQAPRPAAAPSAPAPPATTSPADASATCEAYPLSPTSPASAPDVPSAVPAVAPSPAPAEPASTLRQRGPAAASSAPASTVTEASLGAEQPGDADDVKKGLAPARNSPRWPAALNAAVQDTLLTRLVCSVLAGVLATRLHDRHVSLLATPDSDPDDPTFPNELQGLREDAAWFLPGPFSMNSLLLILNIALVIAAFGRHVGGGAAFDRAARQHSVRCSDGLMAQGVTTVAGLLRVTHRVQALQAIGWLGLGLYGDNSVLVATMVGLHALGA